MKAYLYSIRVCEGVVASIHSMTYTVREIFIPKLKIAFNDQKYFFECDKAREKKFKIIEIPDDLAITIKQAVASSEEAKLEIDEYFNDDKKDN
jgi:hypothetical protein